ncbi:MAG TPA: hypothetical protein PLK76_01575 [bacterium]|nr:hypothetical protein [bacterium]
MKNVLVIISEYLSRFFSVALVGGTLLLFSTFISIPDLWMGGGRSGNIFHNNFGSIFLENFENNYSWFFFFPLLYFTLFFLVISIFLWVYYKKDKQVGKMGFRNVILSLLIIFLLIYFPIRINNFGAKISQMKIEELASYNLVTKISTPAERRELLNVYHSLYQEGLVTWRHDPLKVVEYDLKYGILRSLDGENNELTLEFASDIQGGAMGNTIVRLENDKHQADIHLSCLGGEEDRVWLTYGYEIDKNLIENNFSNDKIEKAISNYLLTEKHFSWKNREDSHSFCTIKNLKPDQELFPLYIWAYCGEYVIEDNELKTVSGSSGPAKIDYPNELSYYDLNKFSYEAPGDGSNYSKDIKRIFPDDVQQKILEHDVEDLIAKAEEYAFTNISNWNLIKQAIANCEIASIMQTHALEVTAVFKDGREITAQEPVIDDIFDIINEYKDKCGEIRMTTE